MEVAPHVDAVVDGALRPARASAVYAMRRSSSSVAIPFSVTRIGTSPTTARVCAHRLLERRRASTPSRSVCGCPRGRRARRPRGRRRCGCTTAHRRSRRRARAEERRLDLLAEAAAGSSPPGADGWPGWPPTSRRPSPECCSWSRSRAAWCASIRPLGGGGVRCRQRHAGQVTRGVGVGRRRRAREARLMIATMFGSLMVTTQRTGSRIGRSASSVARGSGRWRPVRSSRPPRRTTAGG